MTIDPYRLDQSLLVAPDVPFAQIDEALRDLGWVRDDVAPVTADLIPGETELAGWLWQGGRPPVTYTFNPVARLRVLDVGAASPALRAGIAQALPLIAPGDLAALLGATDPRDRLRGVLGAREVERLDLADRVAAMATDPERAVAQTAADAGRALARVAAARDNALELIEVIEEAALPVVRGLVGPQRVEIALSLVPTPLEVAGLFHESLAPHLLRGHDDAAPGAPGPRQPEGVSVQVTACPAGMFRTDNPLSRRFPAKYRDIAGWMAPERVWLAWQFPDGAGGDGLVWTGDRWVWCHEPWALAAKALADIDGTKPVFH